MPGKISYDQLYSSGDAWEALRTSFVNLDTVTYLPGVGEEQKTCAEAYQKITAQLVPGSAFYERWNQYLKGIYRTNDPEGYLDSSLQMLSADVLGGGQAAMKQALAAT